MATADEVQGWPDTRYPNDAEVNQRIRDFGVDPVTKEPLARHMQVHRCDWENDPDYIELLHKTLEKEPGCVAVRPQVMTFASGKFAAVSNALVNCTANKTSHIVDWKQKVSTTTSVTVTAGVEASLWEVVKVSVSASFSMSWTVAQEFSDSYKMYVPTEQIGWLERSPALQTLTGEIWLLIPAVVRFAFWGPGSITGPATDGRPSGVLIAKDRPLTPQEKKAWCSTRQADGQAVTVPPELVPLLDAASTSVIG